jgi:hypothetical protein
VNYRKPERLYVLIAIGIFRFQSIASQYHAVTVIAISISRKRFFLRKKGKNLLPETGGSCVINAGRKSIPTRRLRQYDVITAIIKTT